MPGVDFRQLQFFPRIFERALRSFRSEPFAPAALYEMETHFEIGRARRIDPGPKAAAADEVASAVIEQCPILNASGSLLLDLGAEFLMDLGFGEFAASINERRDGRIAPQFHREGQILDLPRPRPEALGSEFFHFALTAAAGRYHGNCINPNHNTRDGAADWLFKRDGQ